MPPPVLTAALQLGAVDCERFHSGFVAQPVNAWSSLAFLLAGLWIIYGGLRRPDARRELLVFGVVVLVNAIGSFAYHGPSPSWSHWLHDVPALGVPLFVAVHDLGLVRGWPVPRRLRLFGVLLAFLGLLLLPAPGATFTLASILIPLAALGEIGAYRAGFRPRPSDGWSAWMAWWLVVIAALVLAVAAFLLGRTASALCHPGSLLQFHAWWHVLSAIAAAAFAYAGLEHGLSRADPGQSSG